MRVFLAQAPADFCSDAPLDNIVSIDPNGDLVLVVGANLVGSSSTMFNAEKTVAFRVDYRTLARNSSVFKTMFDTKSDNYKPGTSEFGWTEHLPDASPVGLEFLFLVAHYGGFSKVPDSQSLQEIYEIVEMALKYKMFNSLKGKAKPWFFGSYEGVAPNTFLITPSTSATELSKIRSIAITLGHRALTTRVIAYIISGSYIHNGHLHFDGEDLEDPKLDFSSSRIRYLKHNRLKVLREMCNALHSFMRQLQGMAAYDPSLKCPNHRSQNVEEDICESTALGTLERALIRLGEWPLPEPEHMDSWSISTLEAAWCALKIRGFSDAIQKRHRKYECDWASKLHQRIKTAAEILIAFSKKTEDEMKERAAMVGL
ncbi:hypothetical protein PG996_006299 [Apiospora saccharicola]|uniref:BTB domain-containing protein n=1 Tax=Apiospora saccharicola TaxID=335842 RepID=A0ABR1VRM5_9PEZI